MLRRKLLIRIGLLIGAFVVGAVVAIGLLQGALNGIDRTNRDAVILIDGIQVVGVAVTDIQVARSSSAPDAAAAIADAGRRIEAAMAGIGAHPVVQRKADLGFGKLRETIPQFVRVSADFSTPAADVLALSTTVERQVQEVGRELRAYVAAEQAGWGRSFRAMVLGLTLAALVMVNVAIIVLLWTAQVVLRPVGALVEGSRQLAAERFDHRVQLDQKDEFGELAAAYNRLAEQLQANEERKAESLRLLAVTLNHDLNNAMAVIEVQLGLLDRQAGANPTLSGRLREIRASLSRMSSTVASLKNIRRVVLTDYLPGQKMVDLERSVEPSPTGGQAA